MFLFVRNGCCCYFSRKSCGKNVFITDFKSGNIQKQCSPLASGSPRWGWHTSLRMLLVHFIANRNTLLAFILNIQVSCLLPPPLFSRWCHNVTLGSRRLAGVLESTGGHQQCYDCTSQDASRYATSPPFSDEQAVRGLMVKTSSFFLISFVICSYGSLILHA